MLEKSDVWYVPGTGGSPSKIGQKEPRGSRNGQDETQKETLDNKSHLLTCEEKLVFGRRVYHCGVGGAGDRKTYLWITGYAELIPRDPTAALLPVCRRYIQNRRILCNVLRRL
jgi:hypothetical protein